MSRFWKRVLMAAALWRLFGPEIGPPFAAKQEHPLRVPGRTVFVGDREFFLREAGPVDGPPLVLIHGLGNDSLENWYELIKRLRHRYRIVAVDIRNHGKSDKPRERFEISQMADEVAGMMDAVGIDKTAVAGFSMGGMISQELAHRHPHRVDRMVLMGTSAHHGEGLKAIRWLGFVVGRAAERLTGKQLSLFTYWYMLLTGAIARSYARWYRETTLDRDADLYYEAAFAVINFDSREWVGRLDTPALVIISVKDQLVPASWQYDLAGRLRNAEVVELVDGGHEHPWTHADRIATAIDKFVGGPGLRVIEAS
jgi:pimeloyl-ACP methyl ester carboxylesterase